MPDLHTPALLAILDGFGMAAPGPGNAISLARTPVMDRLVQTCPHVMLAASGEDVGLPAGQMGNSEVGHLNIGAGRVVYQELTRINHAIADGSIRENPVLTLAIDNAIAAGGAVHCMGLLSDGGVHSEIEHLEAIVKMAVGRGAHDVCIHAFLDGRDVPPKSGIDYLQQVARFCNEISATTDTSVRIATVSGRFYAMDRDKRWDRVEKAYRMLVMSDAPVAENVLALIEASYAADVTDEFVIPTVVDGAHPGVHDGDTVLFFNFRPDRAREISRAFVDPAFAEFDRGPLLDISYVCLTEYDPSIPAPIAFPKSIPEHVLADYLAEEGLRQLHIAETEKYAHVTFFLNGGAEKPKEGEQRILIPSPKEVATYDLKPQMSAPEVADTLVEAILVDKADVYIVNFANCDMVGHTGVIPAAVQAVEAVDAALGRVLDALAAKGGFALVTADHGNADKMISDESYSPHTAHTLAPVPLVLVGAGDATFADATPSCDGINGLWTAGQAGRLADIAPTFVSLMGLAVPSEWTGKSLLA